MAKRKQNLTGLYISPRLRDSLAPIGRCALTTVVAPMGYGKTTAINWYLAEQAKGDAAVQTIRVSIYSDNLSVFWKSVQKAFAFAGLSFLEQYPCPDDTASASLLVDDLCLTLTGSVTYYLFIDDFHLMTDGRIVDFFCILANRLPENVHVIVASRDRFLPRGEVVRLGGKLHQITAEHLRLNHRELATYAHRCGIPLQEADIAALLHSSEGWFSAVYLNLCFLAEQGTLPDKQSDIYEMFFNALIDPLPPQRQEFLAVMGLADEFSAEMARFITEYPETDQILAALTEQNAFVTRLSDGVTFRFHHMMKACAEQAFAQLEPAKQNAYRSRYGDWYQAHQQYLHALDAYQACGNYDAALQVIQADAGILLAALKPETVLAFLERCPEAVLKEHPLTILVLMRRMFTWRQIPKMMALKGLLEDAIRTQPAGGTGLDPELPDVQRHHRDEPPPPQRQRTDVPPCGEYPQRGELDFRLAVCADDVPSDARDAGERAGRDERLYAPLLQADPGARSGGRAGDEQRSGLFAGAFCRYQHPVGTCLRPHCRKRSGEHRPLLRLFGAAALPLCGHPGAVFFCAKAERADAEP